MERPVRVRFLVFCILFASLTPRVLLGQYWPRADGDVVGRDLAMPGLGWVGHVGMNQGYLYSSTGRILEVLNENVVIVKKTVDDFRSRSKFWGARYYAKCGESQPYKYCNHNWSAVITAGWEQRNWSPLYTYSATYTIGKMVKKNVWDPGLKKWIDKWVRQRAKYRCDSFVIYSYKQGINLNVSRSPQLPKNIWKGLPYDYSWDVR